MIYTIDFWIPHEEELGWKLKRQQKAGKCQRHKSFPELHWEKKWYLLVKLPFPTAKGAAIWVPASMLEFISWTLSASRS